ncbi:hypothetical protein BAUCODRAFT_299981 [Baudoinia panamericana UAMH 10762]|uniref:Uncharacterized protein n=1 Tax=Baudoinia panamericana (strain UAMH 10762) TaxID=717646 RepID=M2MJY8_BAUPA|nr:uncharacterized protein BAUCODRAFT_299981 [Baudoinia panamericana UAMH 10762]EMC91643.1 hypothetical protein BAUCODRAFT_299981 [Baudoinia panamericana UAMH 10762]
MAKRKAAKAATSTASSPAEADYSHEGIDTGANYKIDRDPSWTPVDPEKDFISRLPPEILDRIVSLCVLDFDAERVINATKKPHVLLALATMSNTFHDVVESFCLRQLNLHRERSGFTSVIATTEAKATRRSVRLATQPQKFPRVYRQEYLEYVRTHCVVCDGYQHHRGTIYNQVACCGLCEQRAFGCIINLTTALQEYDLRDYMLIPTRHPGPRSKDKVKGLPTIPYGTANAGTTIILGHCISYKFFKRDVEQVARLLHGDLTSHMRQKRKARKQRKLQKVAQNKREMKIRYHEDAMKEQEAPARKEHHRERLEHYKALDEDGDYLSDDLSDSGYGHYADVHRRICKRLKCGRCETHKLAKHYDKYGMYYIYEDMYEDIHDYW